MTELTLDEETQIVTGRANEAASMLPQLIADQHPEIVAHAIERASTIGEEYNGASFDKTIAELLAEILDELADAVVYLAILLWMRNDPTGATNMITTHEHEPCCPNCQAAETRWWIAISAIAAAVLVAEIAGWFIG